MGAYNYIHKTRPMSVWFCVYKPGKLKQKGFGFADSRSVIFSAIQYSRATNFLIFRRCLVSDGFVTNPSSSDFHNSENHSSCRSLQYAGHGYFDGFSYLLSSIVYHDHSPVIQVSHALARFFPLFQNLDFHGFTG